MEGEVVIVFSTKEYFKAVLEETFCYPFSLQTLVPHGHARTWTHRRAPHAQPTRPLAALRLSCSLPRAPFPLFSIFKSYRSCKVPHQSSFKISTKSRIFSREPSVFPSCQVPSFKFFRPP